MKARSPRLAARAILLDQGRLLLVNAYPDGRSDLWCAPGGGIKAGTSLPDNLKREIAEECGLTIEVGPLALVNEFHDPTSGFHQVELFFRARITGGRISADWVDPAGVVGKRRFFTPAELTTIRLKPDSLPRVAFGTDPMPLYDPLEAIVP